MERRGFTVLELTVVVGMIGILIALVLVGLFSIRNRFQDNTRISQLNDVATALEDFYNVCRVFPEDLVSTAVCPGSAGTMTFGDFYIDIESVGFNESDSPYKYQPLSYSNSQSTPCTGYHLSVVLENDNNAIAQNDANFDSRSLGGSAGVFPCRGNTLGGQNGALQENGQSVYDIKR